VVDGHGDVAYGTLPVGLGVEAELFAARDGQAMQARAERAEGLGGGDALSELDALEEGGDVPGVVEVVGVDDGVVERVLTPQPDLPCETTTQSASHRPHFVIRNHRGSYHKRQISNPSTPLPPVFKTAKFQIP